MPWNLTGNSGTNQSTNFLGTTDSRALVIKTKGVEAARIDKDGNVGIGKSNPQNRLHVGPGSSSIDKSRVNAVIASNNQDAGIAVAQGNGVNVLLQASAAGAFLGTTSNHPVVLRTGDLDRVVVHTDGNMQVGRGSSSIAASRINVAIGSDRQDGGIAIGQNTGVNVLLQASGAGAFLGTTSNHPVILRTGDLDRVVVHTDGNMQVGRGSSSIAASRVNVVIGSDRQDGGIAIGQNTGVNVLLQASGAGAFFGTTSNHPVILRTNDQDRVVIDTNGNMRVNGDIMLANADCAEDFDVAEAALTEPGTVMVLDHEAKLRHSEKAYDKRVAGVVSGAGEYRPAIVLDRQEQQGNRRAIALIGKVFCKVDASDASIEVGDLLTTSATPGHAMKASDPQKAFGAIIGKALGKLDKGRGLIPVLVTLQ
jgi:hypothetical protein